MRRHLCLVILILAVVLAVPVLAQQQDNHQATTSPLVQLLQSKGILTADEAAMVNQASSPSEANQRLAQLLLSKGLITQEDYKKTLEASEQPAAADSSGGHMMSAVVHVGNGSAAAGTMGGSSAPAPAAAKEPPIIPAVAPLRVLPIDIPKQGGLIPDIKLGSGANLKLYGFFKASAIEDTANSGGGTFGGGDDFPLPLLLGDTGPTPGPVFHIKARSFRIGAQFEWVGDAGYTVTARAEYDSEGDFTNQNSVNISSIRNSQLRPRLLYARLDKKIFGDSLPWFAEFGQDWNLVSSTLPGLFETTGAGIGMGTLYERMPQFKTGVQFHTGDLKIQPEFAIVLASQGSSTLTDEQRARFGDRAGADSNQPAIEGRLVFDFPLWKSWKGVPHAEVIVSGHHARMTEVIPFANLPLNPVGGGSVAGATGCGVTPPGPAPTVFTIRNCFPTGVNVSHPQNIWTAELQLPTPWVTFAGKYYRGGDMRIFFEGQVNDAFVDLNGGTLIGLAPSFSNRVIPFSLNSGLINVGSVRPVRGQGGFGELSFPLGRIFGANPEGRNAGWVLRLGYGTDRTDAEDSRITGLGSRAVAGASNPNGLVRTDLIEGSLQYKINKWVSFVNEVSYIDTRATNHGAKVFRGVDATQAHEWRNEFGTIFTF